MRTLVVDANVWVAAADAADPFSDESRTFLQAVARAGWRTALPAFADVEVACALARRLQDAERALTLTGELFRSPLLTTHPLTASFLEQARDVGTRDLLRAGDALYVTLGERLACEVVSWDAEMVERSGASTPTAWLETHVPEAPAAGTGLDDSGTGETQSRAES